MPHQVVWEKLNVFNDKGEPTTLQRGAYLPEFVDEYQRGTLTSIGALKVVDDSLPAMPDSAVAAANTPIPTPELDKPAGNDTREAWVDYARSKGASEDELKDQAEGGLSRNELRDKYND